MDHVLFFIKEQVMKNEVKMTLDILMQSPKYRRMVYNFQNDIDIATMHTKAFNYNTFLKSIPINDLLEATDL